MANDLACDIKSCLTDKPVASRDEDNLKATEYANALCGFIKNADTPVTIGIQGGWGSGKTSLITMLQDDLNNDEDHQALCVLVNAWEHSLFHSGDSKADVALSLLNGLAKGVKKSVAKASWLDPTSAQIIDEKTKKVEKAINGVKLGLIFAGKVATQMLSNMVGGGDVSNVKAEDDKKPAPAQAAVPQIADFVHDLREGLKEMISKITYKQKPVKVVFFIDDLDRVPPPTAVEILDITKNIFDIPNCVFVLAIDYDVVVKGLEEKFGQKNEKNEREFRQYFDKIIQIPFTMPVGAYVKNLPSMLRPALEHLGNSIEDADLEMLGRLAENAELATGGIPRSIKRIINTLSLLQHIANAKSKKSGDQAEKGLPKELEARFIVVALHINYPEICRRLMEKPNFPADWKTTTLNLPWKLDLDKNKTELQALGEDQYFDEDWEQVVYCLCAQSTWLKTQARKVSQMLNNLRTTLNNGDDKVKTLSEDGLEKLQTILEGIRVVSIDSNTASVAQHFDNKSVKTDQVTAFCINMQNALAKALPAGVMDPYENGWAKRGEEGRREFWVDIEGDEGNIYGFYITWEKNNEILYLGFYATRHGVTQKKAKPVVEQLCGENYSFEGTDMEIFTAVEDFTFDSFASTAAESLVPQVQDVYKLTDKTQKALADL